MIKVKDGYAKLIGTTYSGSASSLLLSDGGDKAVSDFAASSHNHSAGNITSGTLPVARGGTGATTFTSGAALIGNGTGAVTTRSITSSATSGSTALITSGGVYTALSGKMTASPTSIELNNSGSLKNYGGFIDFHFYDGDGNKLNSSGEITTGTVDYTSRIIEDAAGRISVNGVKFKGNQVTASGGFVGDVTGNSATATKLKTARTIALTGSVTGSGTFDGSGNLAISTTTNHTHSYAGASSAGGTANAAYEWKEVLLSNGVSLADYYSPGNIYYAGGSNSITDSPEGVDAFGMYNIRCASGWFGQILLSSNKAQGLYYRAGTTTGYTNGLNWKTVLDSSNYTSYTVKKDGTGASGDWDINITGSAGHASTVTVGTGSSNAYRGIVVTNGSNGLYTAGTGTGKPQYNYSTGDVKAYSFTTAGGNFIGNLTGKAATATKLATSRTFNLSTGVTATAQSFDGSANVVIPVTGIKEAYLTWGGQNFSGSYGPIDAALIPQLGANRFAFMPAESVTVEYSTNGGSTWSTYSVNDINKINLFNGNGTTLYIGGSSATKIDKSNYMLRITIATSAASVYTVLNKFIIYCSTSGSTGSYCTIDARLQSNYTAGTNTWVTFADKVPISGWSGYNVINTSDLRTYGNTAASQYGQVRFTFGVTSHASSVKYPGLTINKIFGFGGVGWTTPSTMASTGVMYTYDASKNVTFPAKVTATSFTGNVTGNVSGSSGSCTGNAASATALTSNAGSVTKPIYFSGGKPVECTYSLNKTVPSNALFTDTTYSAGTGLALSGTNFYTTIPRVAKSCNSLPGKNTWVLEEYTSGTGYNLPSNAWYHIYTAEGSDTSYATQLALGMTTDAVYYRKYSSGTWGSWRSLINTDTDTNYYHTRVYSSGLKISTGTGVSDMYVPEGTTSSLGAVKQHKAENCTSYTSDDGATTPAAVKKAVGMFGVLSGYGTCSTAAATAAKVVSIADTNWRLVTGCIIGVKFTNSNSASSVTLNVNSTGAKNIWYNNAKYTSTSTSICGYKDRVIYYMYDGTYWVWLNMGSLDGNSYAYVRQYQTDSTNEEYPLLFRYETSDPDSYVTKYTRYDSAITVNPSTNTITATTFAGNATSATKATNDSDGNAINTTYLKLSGGTMTGNITFPNNKGIIQNQNSGSNYTSAITWLQGGQSEAKYNPSIGHHNTGDTNGAMVLLPYSTDTDPWGGSVGLYVGSTLLKYNGTSVLTSGNYTSYTVKKDGTGASGNWSINAATATAASTVSVTACNSSSNSKKWDDPEVDTLKLKVWDVYDDGGPYIYGNILEINSINKHWKPQLWFDAYSGQMRVRNRDYNVTEFNNWRTILDEFNYTSYVNTTNFPGLNKTGTVTSVATGAGLTGGTITSTGTISINSTYQTYISNGNTAYGWGDHADAGYVKSSGVTKVSTGTGLTGGPITTTGTISLATSGVTAGSYGPSSNVTGSNDTTMSVPYITVDTYGRITSIANKTYTAKNTTYTFENGTNCFYVTPSGGSKQTVNVTPSITNNITGSGTSGYIAKFNGTNTITSGPAFGSSTTTYLRNNGTWGTPPNYYHTPSYSTGLSIAAGTGVNDLYVPYATTSQSGVVNTTDQSFIGNKTFSKINNIYPKYLLFYAGRVYKRDGSTGATSTYGMSGFAISTTRLRAGAYQVRVTNNTGDACYIHPILSPVFANKGEGSCYEHGFAYFSNGDTFGFPTLVYNEGVATFTIICGYMHTQGNWNTNDFTKSNDSGGFTCEIFATWSL